MSVYLSLEIIKFLPKLKKSGQDSMGIAAKFIRKTRLDGVAKRGSASDARAQYSANDLAVKVNGTAVVQYIN